MTTKRASLFAPRPVESTGTPARQQEDTPARLPADLPTVPQDSTPARQPYPKAQTRQGKKSVTVYVSPETMKQLRRLREADEDAGKDTSLQDLMIEAINHLFAARGVTRLAS